MTSFPASPFHMNESRPGALNEMPVMLTRHGFTMIETILVLVIIGVVTAIGLPRLDAFKYRSDATAVMIRSLVMQAQREAVVGQHDLIVSIDTAKHRIILGFDKDNDGSIASTERIRTQALPDQSKFATPPTPLSPDLSDYGSIRAGALQTISGLPSVVFRRDGSLSTVLELYTTSARGRLKDFRVTSVVQATGRTDYLRYDGTAWVKAQ
jgi:prepilin-type N-terminal cleavage/methylation domain-containing protein